MAFVIADRVRESSTTTGTGNFTLGGAITGYQTFDAVLDSGDTTYYTIADQGGADWEVGIGTFTSPSTLARTTILSSSNGGSVVTFTAGTKDVFISLPASKTNTNDQPNVISVNSTSDALRITQTGTGNALLVEDSANPDSSPFVVDASGNVGIGTTTPSALLDVNGNVAITGTTRRITGDFSNATASNRVSFQSSTTNGATALTVLPNGTSTTTNLLLYNAADPTNASIMQVRSSGDGGLHGIQSTTSGSGTLLPIKFFIGGGEKMQIDTSGNALINTTTAVSKLTVNGDVAGTFFVNPTTVSANYTIPTNYNAMTAGVISINSGVTVTVPSGSTWTVV